MLFFYKSVCRFFDVKRPSSADLSDVRLDEVVRNITRGNQSIGPNAVQARLYGQGITVPRQRLRDSLNRVDPQGCAMRALVSHPIQRRAYRVAAPLSLWHIDGNHKLIRYVFHNTTWDCYR